MRGAVIRGRAKLAIIKLIVHSLVRRPCSALCPQRTAARDMAYSRTKRRTTTFGDYRHRVIRAPCRAIAVRRIARRGAGRARCATCMHARPRSSNWHVSIVVIIMTDCAVVTGATRKSSRSRGAVLLQNDPTWIVAPAHRSDEHLIDVKSSKARLLVTSPSIERVKRSSFKIFAERESHKPFEKHQLEQVRWGKAERESVCSLITLCSTVRSRKLRRFPSHFQKNDNDVRGASPGKAGRAGRCAGLPAR